ncbi:hypothetical protein B0H14DRAFT_3503488 [Mycena olivaceomarginata]|nr:hypothetical protein B0H14DRAFT_3503488 [Mycena olivaceomarginata]
MRIPTVGFELGVLLQATGVLGLLGVPAFCDDDGRRPFLERFFLGDGFNESERQFQHVSKRSNSLCLNLAANCIDTVNSGTVNNLWGIKSCVAAATCYGVGDLITSVECQTGFTVTNAAQASLDYTTIYAGIVGSCAFASGGCPITQQNYIDFYYGELTAVNSNNFPRSKPRSPSGAVSETFVQSSTTIIIAIPTTTTTVVIGGASITLAPGGTPINGPLPSGVSLPGANSYLE